jgi:hypothetical protein
MKKLVFLTVFLTVLLAAGFAAAANDTITLTWQGSTNKQIQVDAKNRYIIYWGDGTITDTTPHTSGGNPLTHSYADTTRSYNVTIAGNADSVIMRFICDSQQVSHLDVSRYCVLDGLSCLDNRLPLSELYKISVSPYPWNTAFGTQRLLPQRILIGNTVDYSSQNEFGGIFTNYNLIKNSRAIYYNYDQ